MYFPLENAGGRSAAHARLYQGGLDGCVWTSRRLDSGAAYMFFDRAGDAFGLAVTVLPRVFLNGPDLDWLIDFCAFINIDVEL